jgi:hypothetical protein
MKQRPDIVPLLVLGLLAVLLVGGYYLFPHFFGVIHRTDCIASGRTDCG